MMQQYQYLRLSHGLWHCYADFEVVYTFVLVIQPSECVAEKC